ncbi:hypothetical protein N665_1458s0011 [Sinapis alba]|nr:hypothetical protein N665_1458s0011 [Sinapis alba]
MKKALSLVIFMIFSIMLASVKNKVKANICSEGLGICSQCDERCKARHGPTGQGMCDRYNLCTCNYICGPVPTPPSPPTKQCSGGAGLCDTKCGNPCCNQSCAQKYPGGVGFCESLAHTLLCKCQYPC